MCFLNFADCYSILISLLFYDFIISLLLFLSTDFFHIDNKEIAGWIIDSSQTTAHFNVLKYELGEDTRAQRINEFAPQYFVSEKTDFSKMLLIFYENDMCCRYEQNMLFYKSILAFNEQANIVYKVLSGGHCRGSTKPNEDGKYDYVETMLQWLKNWKNGNWYVWRFDNNVKKRNRFRRFGNPWVFAYQDEVA